MLSARAAHVQCTTPTHQAISVRAQRARIRARARTLSRAHARKKHHRITASPHHRITASPHHGAISELTLTRPRAHGRSLAEAQPAGVSHMLIGECIRHPLRSSHVRALKLAESAFCEPFAEFSQRTGGSAKGGGVPRCGCHSRQPSNDAADE